MSPKKVADFLDKGKNQKYHGGCDCGHIRYELLEKPIFVNCCHCTWCQRETGSAFVINAVIEAKNIKLLSGEPIEIATPSASGKGQVISRCPKCFVAVYSSYAGAGPIIKFVRVGTLDNPNLCPPQAQIFTATKQDWVVLNPDIPAFEIYYDMNELYPPESLARRNALKDEIKAWKSAQG